MKKMIKWSNDKVIIKIWSPPHWFKDLNSPNGPFKQSLHSTNINNPKKIQKVVCLSTCPRNYLFFQPPGLQTIGWLITYQHVY
jgi:hypothetical protein